ncbi:XRE family transcriptional regulator [Rathayibacter festucae]|uniref:helix-turn-helix domain-containing protein n=1 Tax=Rathayibacter festucae TaxID=110937 RepID=UPI002A6B4DF2|nr:XRE family transcriptional regulator [Rathayibacter festucae]MDY0912332.1 XRE family transcriptional regulator [Rathayibacter festucae]
MADDTKEIGRRIAQARERARLTQSDLGVRASLERSAIAKIEGGRRGVGAMELMRIADALGQRFEWLLSDGPSGVMEHRTRLDPSLDLAGIDTSLETLARHVSFVAGIVPALVEKTVDPAEMPTNGAEAESLAALARSACGLPHGSAVRSIGDVVGRVGVMAFSTALGPETADAASTTLDRGAVALVNSTNAVGRRRLALAHELGHVLVRDGYSVDWRVADHSDSDHTEVLLDRFARAFLAPPTAFAEFWQETRRIHRVRTSAVLIGNRFQIDMATIARRLNELDLASAAEMAEVRGTRTNRADIVEHGLFAPIDLEGTTVPSAYARAVLTLYRAEELSAERALGLLAGTFEHDDLPLLPERHENEIWSLLR